MTDPEDQAEPDGYSLRMPFVVCRSQGGPWEDQPFAAGYECGAIDAALQQIPPGWQGTFAMTVRAANLPQLDLIAMSNGFHHTKHQLFEEAPEWVAWSCTRTAEALAEGTEP